MGCRKICDVRCHFVGDNGCVPVWSVEMWKNISYGTLFEKVVTKIERIRVHQVTTVALITHKFKKCKVTIDKRIKVT